MSAIFLELNRTILFLSSPLAPHGEVEKALLVARLATKKLLVSVDDVVGLELIATTLSDKYIATLLPDFVLVRCWQRLESLFTYITGVNPFLYAS